MTDRELMQQALEALEKASTNTISRAYRIQEAITALHKRLAQGGPQPWEQTYPDMGNPFARQEQEPVAHVTVAGVLFDFMGWLTSRKERLVLSSSDEASPAVEAITEFAKMRGLSLADADVQSWQQALAAAPLREWVGLTDEEELMIGVATGLTGVAIRMIESKFKEKNGK